MARVVVTGGILECSHGGKLRLTAGDGRLQIGNAAAVTDVAVVGLAFAAPETPLPNMVAPCPVKTTSNPPLPSPCVAVQRATQGTATRLSVGGNPVLLDGASGPVVNAQSPGSTWKVSDAGQQLLEAS